MAYTTPRTWVAGDVLTAAQLNQHLRDNIAFLANPPGARAQGAATVSHATTATFQAVAFTVEDYDNDTIHDNVTNNSRFTAKTAGRYLVYGNVRFTGNATGARIVGIRKNGTGTTGPTHGSVKRANLTVDSTDLMVATEVDMAVNDWVEIVAWQNSGAALNMENSGGTLHAGIRWMSFT